jgi:hypothetical protein
MLAEMRRDCLAASRNSVKRRPTRINDPPGPAASRLRDEPELLKSEVAIRAQGIPALDVIKLTGGSLRLSYSVEAGPVVAA